MKENYRLDDLEIKDYKIYQNPSSFCFGIDSILLANFITRYIKKNDKYIDLCTGSAVIPVLVYAKRELKNTIVGVEIDNNTATMANDSIVYNSLQKNINILKKNIKDLSKDLYDSYDVVSVNPPYFKIGSGNINCSSIKSIARHEISCNLDDIIRISSKLLKMRGSFFMVNRTERFEEVIVTTNKYNIHAKEIIFIQPRNHKDANLFLIRGIKNSGTSTKIHPPIVIYNEDGNYTKEYLNFCHGNNC